jgi:hypothetical protein
MENVSNEFEPIFNDGENSEKRINLFLGYVYFHQQKTDSGRKAIGWK